MTRPHLLLILLMLTACAAPIDPLQGVWTVDQEATLAMATAKDAVWLNRNLRPLTNGMTLEFSASTIRVGDPSGKERSRNYTVVESTEDGMVLLVNGAERSHRVTIVLRKNRMVMAENDRAMVLRR